MDKSNGLSPLLGAVDFCGIGDIASRIDRSRTLIVTDRNIHGLFGGSFPDCPLSFVPAGEAAKSLDVLAELYRRCLAAKMDRGWNILAIGGGTVSDIAGFVAHTWMRGIGLFVAPTTLLSMTDAALGGKNGVDFQGYKNIIGSFHMPKAVFCDIDTLRTLDAIQFESGMAEVIKHAIIDGEGYFSFLEDCLASYGDEKGFNYGSCPASVLRRMVSESQKVKLGIVERDPKESGERRILNLGHTFGHAIEIVGGFPHGHAVSLGIALASSFSLKNGWMGEQKATRILALLKGFGLPVDVSEALAAHSNLPAAGRGISGSKDFLARVEDALVMDKKREGAHMNLVVPRDIGDVRIEKIAVTELKAFLGGVLS